MFPLALLPLKGFLFRYWKAIAIFALAIVVLGGIYLKGRSDTKRKYELRDYKERERRVDEERKEIERGQQFRRKVEENRRVTPNDDARDSCLLSAENPAEECKKYLFN